MKIFKKKRPIGLNMKIVTDYFKNIHYISGSTVEQQNEVLLCFCLFCDYTIVYQLLTFLQ